MTELFLKREHCCPPRGQPDWWLGGQKRSNVSAIAPHQEPIALDLVGVIDQLGQIRRKEARNGAA